MCFKQERRRSKTSLVRKELAAGVTQANRRTEGLFTSLRELAERSLSNEERRCEIMELYRSPTSI